MSTRVDLFMHTRVTCYIHTRVTRLDYTRVTPIIVYLGISDMFTREYPLKLTRVCYPANRPLQLCDAVQGRGSMIGARVGRWLQVKA